MIKSYALLPYVSPLFHIKKSALLYYGSAKPKYLNHANKMLTPCIIHHLIACSPTFFSISYGSTLLIYLLMGYQYQKSITIKDHLEFAANSIFKFCCFS